jgi:hypothetical protein
LPQAGSCGEKNFKTIWVGLSVGKVRSVCVKLKRNCLSIFGRFVVVVSFSTLAGNGLRLGEEADLIAQNCPLGQMFLESTTVQ